MSEHQFSARNARLLVQVLLAAPAFAAGNAATGPASMMIRRATTSAVRPDGASPLHCRLDQSSALHHRAVTC
jgi:hypothetical protein